MTNRNNTFTETTPLKVIIRCQWSDCEERVNLSRIRFDGGFDWWGQCHRCGGQHQRSVGDKVRGVIYPIPPAPKVEGSDLLDSDDLARLLGVQPSTLRSMRAQPGRHRSIDGLPSPIRLIGNSPVWDRQQVAAWLEG